MQHKYNNIYILTSTNHKLYRLVRGIKYVAILIRGFLVCFCCLLLQFVITYNSSMIVTAEGDRNLQAYIVIVNGTIDGGLNIYIIYTLQDEASQNML